MARSPGRQALARRRVLDYVRRLGLRRAAERLDTTTKELRRWLSTSIPASKLSAAIGLGKPGGKFVFLKGSRLTDLIKKHGLSHASRLTGIPGRELAELAKKRPGSAVKLDRDRLRQLNAKKGREKLAELLGVKPGQVDRANKPPIPKTTKRLKKFVDSYGDEATASFLGVSLRQLNHWLKKGIPRSWEGDVSQILGRTSSEGPDEQALKKGRPPVPTLDRTIASARRKVEAWNKKAPSRYHIRLGDIERWVRLGIFEQKLAAIKAAHATTRKPGKPTKRKPAPPRPPETPIVPPGAGVPKPPRHPPGEKPPRPPRPGPPRPPGRPPRKPPGPPPSQISAEKKRNFHQARIEAMTEGRYPVPQAPWSLIQSWKLMNRRGIHVYRKVEKFVHEIDLNKLGDQVVTLARRVWARLPGDNPIMTVKFTFAAMGDGNPFYPDGFIEGNDVNFFSRKVAIYYEWEIERLIRSLLREIWEVDAEQAMLFLEYYEIVKSLPL